MKSIEILDLPTGDISNDYSNDYSFKSGKQIVLNHENTAVLFRRAPLFSKVRTPFEEITSCCFCNDIVVYLCFVNFFAKALDFD